ncbi:MAG: glycoside hydrolase family 99-like domain-containing protein [Tannerella sp.]|jgi:hypothetical protein|nr:glycoside hydrolase family 99-like domain-containing protein [Tannerella sp.]
MKKIILLFLLSAILLPKAFAQQKYDVAAFVWPSYHPDDRAKIFWPDGIGEWQTVKSNKAKFAGHTQPRFPLWGYVNEADPYVMEMEIAAATRHGVNVFIYDWYWYDGMPFLEGCLNNGFLKAANSRDMKFYLMWANHDVNQTWDKRLAGKPNSSLIWKGGVDRKQFEIICKRVIEKYFSQPNYYTVDGKPSFMIYEMQTFIDGMGGLKEAKDALEWFRKEVKKAGYKGLDLQLTLRANMQGNITGIAGDNIGTQMSVIKELGFDGATHYQYCHFLNIDRDYTEIQADAVNEWQRIDNVLDIPYYPHVSIGWDNNPRFEMQIGGIVKNNTPANVEKALRNAKAFVDAHPGQAPLITVNSWNEWTETSYLQPCTMFGYGYLEAVKAVFSPSK